MRGLSARGRLVQAEIDVSRDVACRFRDEIRAARDYWLKRLRRMDSPKRQPPER